MKKMTFEEFYSYMKKANEEGRLIEGVIVFERNPLWIAPLTELQRSYKVSSKNKFFLKNKPGDSLLGNRLDGVAKNVRLDKNMFVAIFPWHVEFCYLLEEEYS